MFINPKTAIESGWIKGLTDPDKQIQPNAIDFTLDELKAISQTGVVPYISDEPSAKTMRQLLDVAVSTTTNSWHLKHGVVYDGTSNIYVEVPDGMAAVLFTRSTFARNGLFIVSGLYDSGYKGHIGFTLYPVGGSITIGRGTRVGQIAFISADAAKQYEGGYNHAAGTHYTEAKPEAEVATKKEKKNVKQETNAE